MTVTNYAEWVADGSPWHPAAPVDSLAQTLRRHGYTVYILGNMEHLKSSTPEDHDPYSHTSWPGAQPYPFVLAEDIMPGGAWPLDKLGAKIFADKQAGNAGLAGLKYMNWTDSNGKCWHDKWTPNHVRTSSNDKGHIHLSWRTDFVNKSTNYDPINGGIMGELFVAEGSTGEGVKYIQTLLNDLGAHPPVTVNGDYGKATTAAVNSYRAAHGQGAATSITGWMLRTMQLDLIRLNAGKDGLPGKPGAPGASGKDGKDGKDGQLSGTVKVTGGSLTLETTN
jgi:hypothetical protein